MDLAGRTLIIDCDDVLLDTHKQFVVCLEEKFGKQERFSRLRNQWEVATVLTPEENDYLWSADNGYCSVGFHEQIRFKDDALMTANAMINRAEFAYVLTDCPVEVQGYRRDLIRSYLPPRAVLYFTNHANSKSMSEGMSKAEFIRQLVQVSSNRVVVCEDAPHNIGEILGIPEVERIFVFDYPYNRHIEDKRISRVSTWKEVAELVNE